MTYEKAATPGEGAAAMNVGCSTFDSQNYPENQVSTLAAMKAARRWIIRDAKKKPHYADGAPRQGTLDTPADLARLVSCNEADAAARAKGEAWGRGFALGPDSHGGFWQGIDLDHIAETGVGHFVDQLPGYVEISPSGDGVHAIGYGFDFDACGSDGSGTEAYAHGRYFTFTDNVVRDAPLSDLSSFVASEIVPYREARKASIRKVTAKPPAPTTPFETNDETLADIFGALGYFDPDNRHEWMQVIHAGNTYGEAAREAVRRWSAMSGKHTDGEFNAKWHEVQPQHTSYRWIFAEASRRGWANPRTSGNWWNGNTVPETTLAANMAFVQRAFGSFGSDAPAGASQAPIGFDGFDSAPTRGFAENQWPDPTPLPSPSPPVVRFDPAYLPEAFAPRVMDIAERMQCAPDYVANAIVVAAGTLVGTKVGLRPKPNDTWTVTPNFWAMNIGRPGTMKSPAVAEAMAPLKRYENIARQESERAKAAYARQMIEYNIHFKKAEKDFKDGKGSLNLPEPPVEPKRQRFIVTDATYEKASMILEDNPNGVLLYRDELGPHLVHLGREENTQARGFYLIGWNGTDSYSTDRVGRADVHIERLCISMLGSIQPGRLQAFVGGALKGGEADDGMMQRFGCAVWPDQSKDWKPVDRAPNGAALAAANVAFDNLHNLVVNSSNSTYDMMANISYVTFDYEAAKRFMDWLTELELLLRSGELNSSLESHFAKYRKLVPALALINHLVDCGVGPVGVTALERAIRYAEYFKSHAYRIYGAATHSDVIAAHAILARIRKRDLADGFTLRDIHRRGWSGLTDNAEVGSGLEMLVEYGWLSAVAIKNDRGGRPSVLFNINPGVWS